MFRMTIERLVTEIRISSSATLLLFGRIFKIAKPFFRGPKHKEANTRLLKTVLLLWAYIFVNVRVSYALKDFMDALQGRQVHAATLDWIYYALWLGVMTPLFVNYGFNRSMMGLDWRKFTTRLILDLYSESHAALRLNSDPAIDNPEQRISQNTKDYSLQAPGLFFSILEGFTTFVVFLGPLAGISLQLTAVACAYPSVGSCVAWLIGRTLPALTALQDKLEADLRVEVGWVRQHAFSIALMKGEKRERQWVGEKFEAVAANFHRIVVINKRLAYFTTYYNYMVPLIPSLIIARYYIHAELTWGELAQSGYIFAQMYGSSALVISQFPNFSDFASTVNRFGSFWEALLKHHDEKADDAGIRVVESDHFALDRLLLLKSDTAESLLNRPLTLKIETGSSLAVIASAEATAMLMRAVADLEQPGTGTIYLPSSSAIFLPQPPYVPVGTLREVLAYPHEGTALSDALARKWLKLLKLDKLEAAYGLDEKHNWIATLEVADQQRLSLARLFLSKPKYVFLDEPTIGLEADAEQIFTLLKGLDATIVTATRLPDMARHHEYVLELPGDGSWNFAATDERTLALAQ